MSDPVVPPAPTYVLKRSRRRTLALHVLPDGSLEVRAPLRLPLREIERFVRDRAGWVRRRREQLERDAARLLWSDAPLSDGSILHVRGKAHAVRLVACRRRSDRASATETPGESGMPMVVVPWADTAETALPRPPLRDEVRARVVRMYRSLAQDRLAAMLPDLVRTIGASPSAIAFRLQRARWGSCSRGGRISLNILCAALPDPLFEYVVCHELCHLRHLDHGPEFWRTLQTAMPDMAERRRELRGWRLR